MAERPTGARSQRLFQWDYYWHGSAVGIVSGGLIASMINWRASFFIVGFAGLLVAPIFRLTLREPPRGRFDKLDTSASPPTFRNVLAALARKRSFWSLAVGGAASSMIGYGLLFWMPSFLVRSFGLTLLSASRSFG